MCLLFDLYPFSGGDIRGGGGWGLCVRGIFSVDSSVVRDQTVAPFTLTAKSVNSYIYDRAFGRAQHTTYVYEQMKQCTNGTFVHVGC